MLDQNWPPRSSQALPHWPTNLKPGSTQLVGPRMYPELHHHFHLRSPGPPPQIPVERPHKSNNPTQKSRAIANRASRTRVRASQNPKGDSPLPKTTVARH